MSKINFKKLQNLRLRSLKGRGNDFRGLFLILIIDGALEFAPENNNKLTFGVTEFLSILPSV